MFEKLIEIRLKKRFIDSIDFAKIFIREDFSGYFSTSSQTLNLNPSHLHRSSEHNRVDLSLDLPRNGQHNREQTLSVFKENETSISSSQRCLTI